MKFVINSMQFMELEWAGTIVNLRMTGKETTIFFCRGSWIRVVLFNVEELEWVLFMFILRK